MGATRTARLTTIAAALIATALLAGCGTQTPIASGSDATSPPQAPAATVPETPDTAPDTTEAPAVGAFGDPYVWEDGVKLTVTSVKRAKLGEYDTVSAGNRAIVAHIKVTNGATGPLDASMVSPTVYTGDQGEPADQTFLTGYNQIEATRVQPGRSVSGDYVFEVPRTATTITVEVGPGFEYEPAVFTGKIS
jgi:hypothetical protein